MVQGLDFTCAGMAAKDNPKNKKILQKHGFMRIKQRLIYQKFLLPSKGYIQMVGHRVTGTYEEMSLRFWDRKFSYYTLMVIQLRSHTTWDG